MRVSIYFVIIFLFASCSKDENKKIKFGWYKEETRLVYDFYSATDTIQDFRVLLISKGFLETSPNGPNPYEVIFDQFKQIGKYTVKRGGLYGIECKDCRFGFFGCSEEFNFLMAPNAPSLNQELPVYSCGEKITGINKVIEINKTVSVPYGTFETYVILHPNGDKSFWNADNGLIMYENTNGDIKNIGILKLSTIIK
jgi:hypothetical protein